ncbi:lysophospholipid acyltransferase family protein [Roseovarius aestuarii]|nr:lysophospholipid acyltransferase family protein [Roseovarius aestuarii]
MSQSKDSFVTRAGEYMVNMVLRGLIGAAQLTPYRFRIPAMGWITAHVIAPLAGYSRRVRENLELVLPDLPQSEVRALMRSVPDNAGRGIIELYSSREFIERARHSPLIGPGLTAMHAARAEGRPIIIVTGHFGSFNAGRMALIENGFKMGSFYRPLKNRYFNPHYAQAMGALSEPLFAQSKRGMVQMVKHLKGGGVVAILNDLNAHDGVPLQFFGKPALTSLVTAEMALRCNALLVPCWGLRRENGLDFETIVENPIEHSDPVTMTQDFNDRLEVMVRKHMDQWFWVHRRWKDGTGGMADRGAARVAAMQDRSSD